MASQAVQPMAQLHDIVALVTGGGPKETTGYLGRAIASVVRRWPLTTFFGLTVAFTWALLPLAGTSIAFSLIALCGPAAAALATAALLGFAELNALRGRVMRWRVPGRWYLLALVLPLPASALASGLAYLAGAAGPVRFQEISALQAVVFVLVAGEEIGWRGFALPILLTRFSPWRASGVLGVVWALWHLPLFYMPEMPQYGSPFAPFVAYTVALSLILTVLARQTAGSVVIATLFHGAVNTLGFVNAAATPAMRGWGNAVSYGLAALIVSVVASRRSRTPEPGRAA
jgi:membrane protease YdiL (CAAX protease family)